MTGDRRARSFGPFRACTDSDCAANRIGGCDRCCPECGLCASDDHPPHRDWCPRNPHQRSERPTDQETSTDG